MPIKYIKLKTEKTAIKVGGVIFNMDQVFTVTYQFKLLRSFRRKVFLCLACVKWGKFLFTRKFPLLLLCHVLGIQSQAVSLITKGMEEEGRGGILAPNALWWVARSIIELVGSQYDAITDSLYENL